MANKKIVIYDGVHSIVAFKIDDKGKKQYYEHKFNGNEKILGLPDGSLRISAKNKLWRLFK